MTSPLPELVDFRISASGMHLHLFIREGERDIRKRICLTRPGAGLDCLTRDGVAYFQRGEYTKYDEQTDIYFQVSVGRIKLQCTHWLMENLALTIWGRSTKHLAEGVQPAQSLAEAAD